MISDYVKRTILYVMVALRNFSIYSPWHVDVKSQLMHTGRERSADLDVLVLDAEQGRWWLTECQPQ